MTLPNCTDQIPLKYPDYNIFSDFNQTLTNTFNWAIKGSILFQQQIQTHDSQRNSQGTFYLYMLADWFVLFCIFMQINIFAYKVSQRYKVLPLFKKKGHPQFIEFLSNKQYQYKFYANFLLFLSVCQILQSCIQLIYWRGVPYFDTPAPPLYCYTKPISQNQTSIYCFQKIKLSYTSLCNYTKQLNPLFYPISKQKNAECLIFILIWYLLRYILNTGQLFFCFVMIGKNKNNNKGKQFVRHNLVKSLFYNTVVIFLQLILAFRFDYKVYYRYNSLGVTIVNIIEKILFFFLIFDKTIVKSYLQSKTKSKDVNINGIQWREQINKIQNKSFEILREKIIIKSKNSPFYQQNFVQLHAIYEQNYQRNLQIQVFQKNFWRYDHNPQKLFQVRWNVYINYIFIITITGLIGYFILMVKYSKNFDAIVQNPPPDQLRHYYFNANDKQTIKIGCILVLVEIVLLKMSRDIVLINVLFKEVTQKFQYKSKILKCQDYRQQL